MKAEAEKAETRAGEAVDEEAETQAAAVKVKAEG